MLENNNCKHILRERISPQRVRAYSRSHFDWRCLQCGKIIEFSENFNSNMR